jgi:membrane protease YdiL (CAAX protease family)
MTAISSYQKSSTQLVGIMVMLLLLFLVSLLGSPVVFHQFGLSKINAGYFFVSRLLYWLCLIVVWRYSSKIEKQNLLLWGEKKYKALFHLLSIIALAITIVVSTGIADHIITSIIHQKECSIRLQEMVDLFRTNKYLLFFTALTAGVTEELLFRGYLLPRLELLFKNPYIAIFISSLLFGLMHYRYGTLTNAIGPFIIGIIFAIYYWKYRNITLLILFHFVWDVFGLYALLKH